MRLFKVSCELASPAIVDRQPIHLDAILWSASREKRKRQERDVPLPVWSLTMYGERIAMASALLPGEHHYQQITMIKRRDGVDVQHLARRLHRGLGPGKDKMRPQMAIDGRLEWLAVTGRRRPLYKILKRVLAIGRDIRSGHGRVSEWSVDPIDTEALDEVLIGPDGRLRRNVPVRWCSSVLDTAKGGLRPPYWESHSDVAPVGGVAVLDREVVRLLKEAYDIAPKPRPQDLRRKATQAS